VLILLRVDSTRLLKSSLSMRICSCLARSARRLWVLRTCTWRLSMQAAGIRASSIGSGS
jgi:hypothetical protein